jgi:hypothetical protein
MVSRVAPATAYTRKLEIAIGDGFFDQRRKFALFHYWSARQVIEAGLKDGEPSVVRELEMWLRGTLPSLEDWLDEADCQYVIVPPGHVRGSTGSPPMNYLAGVLTEVFPSITFVPDALRRLEGVTSFYHDGVRPGLQQHLLTIGYTGPTWRSPDEAPGFLIFDDQCTDGTTSDACAAVLRRNAGIPVTRSLFMSRSGTQSGLGRALVKRLAS